MKSPFYAYLSRLKHIQRWSLMRNSDSENVMEHSWMVAIIAHGLCVTHNENHPDTLADEGRVALMAIYHDVTEVLTGDLPTIKYSVPFLPFFCWLGPLAHQPAGRPAHLGTALAFPGL